MKKLFITGYTLFLSLSMYAQTLDETVVAASRKTTKELTPQQVIDSLEHRFPNAKSVEYFQTTGKDAKNGWTVTEQEEASLNTEINYYTISFNRDDFQYYALYDPKGVLVSYKYQQKVTTLPPAIISTIKNLSGEKYKEYNILSETYYKSKNYNKSNEYYEIKAVHKTDPKNKKTLIFSPDGKLIKMKG